MRRGPLREHYMRHGPLREHYMRRGPLREHYMRHGPLREHYMRHGPLREHYIIYTYIHPHLTHHHSHQFYYSESRSQYHCHNDTPQHHSLHKNGIVLAISIYIKSSPETNTTMMLGISTTFKAVLI